MKTLTQSVFIMLLAISPSLFAHTDLKASTPSNEAILEEIPETIILEFTGNVRLIKLTLDDSQGEAIDLGFEPDGEPANIFTQELPELTPDSYTVKWTSMGKDTHKISGQIDFIIQTEGEDTDPINTKNVDIKSDSSY